VKSPQSDKMPPNGAANASDNSDPDAEFRTGLLNLIPFLRAFSRSLCGDRELADDLAQDALAKAWQARNSFRPGSNLKGWLFTILRNEFYSNRRRAWRQVPWDEDASEQTLSTKGEQTWAVLLSDTTRMLFSLPLEQREALILVGAGGFSYEDAAKIANCAVGTIKSRVARARKALMAAVDGESSLPRDTLPTREEATNEILAEVDRLVSHEPSSDDEQGPGHGVES
jgi:RNA polymerase sigma-70 factor (ECF subfamily)